VLLLLAVPLVLIPVGAYVVASDASRASSLPVAQGLAGGVFHPIAGGFVADDRTVAVCETDRACLEQAFGNIAFAQGPRRALAAFEAELVRNKDVERGCHRIVHTIGSATYARYEGDVARTFAEGSPVCASGYYHGILERAFAGISSKARLGEAARELCVSADIRRRGFLDYQCRHGLGHGLMIQTGYDLPTALSLCSTLGSGWDRVSCTGGAFMENVSTRFGFRSSWLDEEDPLYPCNRIAAVHRPSCFTRATTWILQVERNDFARTAAHCADTGRWAPFCFRGFGRDAVVEARYRDFRKVHELCALSDRYAPACYVGAGRTFSDGAGILGMRRAARFCDRAGHSSRDHCFAGVGLVIGMLHSTDAGRRRACSKLTSSHARACARAAAEEVAWNGKLSWG
jgi:hypothetical protein